MIRLLSLLVGILLAQSVSAQFSFTYKPDPIDSPISNDINKFLISGLAANQSAFEHVGPKKKEFVGEIYQNGYIRLKEDFQNGRFLVSSPLSAAVQTLIDEIKKSNGIISDDLTGLVRRSDVPNAINYGNGLIGVNLGLLVRLENRDQLLFILCHEIGHTLANHSRKTVEEIVELNFNKELKNKVSKAHNQRNNNYTDVKRILLDVQFMRSKYSKAKEYEADSIGLQLYLKTSGNPQQAIRCLELLDSIDIPAHEKLIDFKEIFNFDEYPFEDNWLKYTKAQTWHRSIESLYPDSLRTHPNCRERIASVRRQLNNMQWQGAGEIVSFDQIKLKARFEQIASSFYFKEYGKSLYYTLNLLSDYKDNRYLHAMAGRNLYFLFKSREKHEQGKVLELPDPRFSDSYDRFLSFIHGLRLGELEALSYYYLTTKPRDFFEDEEFAYSLWLGSKLKISKLDKDMIAADYRKNYPHGKYINELTLK